MTRGPALSAAALGLLLLAGCTGFGVSFGGHDHSAGGPDEWVKAGSDPARTAAEYRDCADRAEQATNTEADIDQDIAAARSGDMERAQIVRMQARQMHEKTRAHAGALVAACMSRKGFARRP